LRLQGLLELFVIFSFHQRFIGIIHGHPINTQLKFLKIHYLFKLLKSVGIELLEKAQDLLSQFIHQ